MGLEALGLIVLADERRRSPNGGRGAGSPGARENRSRREVRHVERRRALGCPEGEPGAAALEPDRAVAAAVHERTERPVQVERSA